MKVNFGNAIKEEDILENYQADNLGANANILRSDVIC